jgi:coenzyme F420-0:L-glutamate ligase/coenzyme F420-1:gamma-L-glutamate ligase
MADARSLSVIPIEGIGEITQTSDLAAIFADRCGANRDAQTLCDGDVLVVTQKIVSKAEGRLVSLDHSDEEAKVALIEQEATRILRRRGSLLITETTHGFVCANAGIDLSNVDDGTAALLPIDPDRSARRIRADLRRALNLEIAVIVSDTFGRVWRQGVTDIALGSAGIVPVLDLRGTLDANGRELVATEICVVDEITAAADLVMGKATNIPAAIVRGCDPEWFGEGSVADDVIRRPEDDLFR